jgi:predicted dehydrogenase
VQDKLWLPGLIKLKHLIDEGFFGKIISLRGEFGYWVFEGEDGKLQRPSWNYRKEDGGGIIIDMLCHWRYVIDNLFGDIQSLTNLGATHIPQRWDENGEPYDSTADDSAYTTMMLENDTIVHMNSSWCVRPRRDDLLVLQVDGIKGSAYAGLRKCLVQKREDTPWVVWNPDVESKINYFDGWSEVEPGVEYDNAFKVQWELFLKHVVYDEPFRWTLLEGAKGVQLAEKGIESWQKRAWVDLDDLE